MAQEHKKYWSAAEVFAHTFFSQLEEFEATVGAAYVNKQRFTISMPMRVVWDFAVQALTMNYRLNADLMQFFRLCESDADLIRIAAAAVEMPVRLEMLESQKKTEVPTRIGIPVSQFM